MLHRLRTAGLVWPLVLALPALALLIGLGLWQMQRKAWKDGLIEAMRNRSTLATPVLLEHLAGGMAGGDQEYLRVALRGQFQHDQERYLYAPDQRLGPGHHVYTPLHLRGGGMVYVNRGFVPEHLKHPAQRPQGQIAGAVNVVGLIREPETKAYFTPANDPKRNVWYWRDIAAMFGCRDGEPGTVCATDAERTARASAIARFSIDALAEPANPGDWPKGGTTILDIPNRHLEYALTWFALAATLIGVLVAFAAGKLRRA